MGKQQHQEQAIKKLVESVKRTVTAADTLPTDKPELGLFSVLAYHCFRCGYVWLPRDYNVAYDDLTKVEPPKACARCKSKYWRQMHRRKGEQNTKTLPMFLHIYRRMRKGLDFGSQAQQDMWKNSNVIQMLLEQERKHPNFKTTSVKRKTRS